MKTTCSCILKVLILASLTNVTALSCMHAKDQSSIKDDTHTTPAAPIVLGQGIFVRTNFAATHLLQLQYFPEFQPAEVAYPSIAVV